MRRIERDPGLRVVGRRRAAGAESELEASIGEEIERGRLRRHQRRMPEVVGQPESPDTQGGGRGGRSGKGRAESELAAYVVGREQRGITQALDLSCLPHDVAALMVGVITTPKRKARNGAPMSAPAVR